MLKLLTSFDLKEMTNRDHDFMFAATRGQIFSEPTEYLVQIGFHQKKWQ